jgi:hypothetical protein
VAYRLFCGIVAGYIPATRVLDSRRTLAFQDIGPQAPVDVLIIPGEPPRSASLFPAVVFGKPAVAFGPPDGPADKSFGTPDGGVQIK